MPTTELPQAPTVDTPANAPAVRYREQEIAIVMEALNHPEVDGSIIAAADLLEMDRERAKKLVTKALARTLQLPEVNGNIAAAAAKLGLNYQAAYKLVLKNNFMSATHPSRDPDTMTVEQLDTIARAAVLAPEEIREIEAMSKQEAALAKGDFEALGIKADKAETFLSLEKFAQRPISDMLNLTHGGLMFGFVNLVDIFKTYKDKLDSGQLPMEYDGAGQEKNVERDWIYAMVALSGEIRQINQQVQRTQMLRLKAKELEKVGSKGSSRPKKPGFGVMLQVDQKDGGSVKVAAVETEVNEEPEADAAE